MSVERIETYLGRLNDGRDVVRTADGSIRIEASKTNHARLRALNDADVEEAMRDDPDWRDDRGGLLEIDWSKARLANPPKKQAISIRIDEDVLEFLKKEGPGYQKRINALLRHYVSERKKSA
jgi:uncharacterized protein (DUF4415 family)